MSSLPIAVMNSSEFIRSPPRFNHDCRLIAGTVFGELPPWGRLWRSKDDDAVGSRGLHRGHGVGGARRLGVHLPDSGQ